MNLAPRIKTKMIIGMQTKINITPKTTPIKTGTLLLVYSVSSVAEDDETITFEHSFVHESLFTLFPSSHSSVPSAIPSPQMVQTEGSP